MLEIMAQAAQQQQDKTVMWLSLATALLGGGAIGHLFAWLKTRIEAKINTEAALWAKIAKLDDKIDELQRENDVLRDENSALRSTIADQCQRIEELENRLNNA